MQGARKFKGVESIFATRLTELIEKGKDGKKVNQQELADAVGTTRQAISQYASGAIQPNAEKIYYIANYFNVSADYLLGITSVAPKIPALQAISKVIGLTEKAIRELKKDVDNSSPMSNNPNNSVFNAVEDQYANYAIKPTRGQIVSLLLEDDGYGCIDNSVLYLLAQVLAHKSNRDVHFELMEVHNDEGGNAEFDEEEFIKEIEEAQKHGGWQGAAETVGAKLKPVAPRSVTNEQMLNLRLLDLEDYLRKFKERLDLKGIELWML